MGHLKLGKRLKVRHMTSTFCLVTIIVSLVISSNQSYASHSPQCISLLSESSDLLQGSPRHTNVQENDLSFLPNGIRWAFLDPTTNDNQVVLGLFTSINTHDDSYSFAVVSTILKNMPIGSTATDAQDSSNYFPRRYLHDTYIEANWSATPLYLDVHIIMKLLYELKMPISTQQAMSLKNSVTNLLQKSAIQDQNLRQAIQRGTEQLILRASGPIHKIDNRDLRAAFLDPVSYNSTITSLERFARMTGDTISFADLVIVLQSMPKGNPLYFSSGNHYFPYSYLAQRANQSPPKSKQDQYLDFSIIMHLLNKLEKPLNDTQRSQLKSLVWEVIHASKEYLKSDEWHRKSIADAIESLLE